MYHQSTFIFPDNSVLIGGENSSYLAINTDDVFDGTRFMPVENTMMHGRVGYTLTYLPTINKVLITGGSNGNTENLMFFDTIEICDVITNRFQTFVCRQDEQDIQPLMFRHLLIKY